MPLYEYECDSCQHRFEVIQKFSDALVDTCPKCGSAVQKLMSSPAFQFKGSGWYITDYAKKDSLPRQKPPGGQGQRESGRRVDSDGGRQADRPTTSTSSTPAPAPSATTKSE